MNIISLNLLKINLISIDLVFNSIMMYLLTNLLITEPGNTAVLVYPPLQVEFFDNED
jgi:hypothetical protein